MTKHAQPVVPIIPHSLKGVLNEQVGPGHKHSFTASVDVEIEVDWKVELVSATPQGTNPLVKLLAFHVKLPHGPHSNAIAKRTLHYTESPPHAKYSTVTIEDGKDTLSAKVAIVV